MISILLMKLNTLIKEKQKLENKLNNTPNVFHKKRELLSIFINEIDNSIEILECDISNYRNKLINLGFDPDTSIENKSVKELEREYDLLMDIGSIFVPNLGILGIEYALDDNKEMLTLELLDMLYLKGIDISEINYRKKIK